MRVVLLSSRGARFVDVPFPYPVVRVAEVTDMSAMTKWYDWSSDPLPVEHREFKRLDALSYEERE